MKNDLNVRKLHNGGISHTIAKTNYMKHYEGNNFCKLSKNIFKNLKIIDPKKILDEERKKTPCKRYFGGYCKFEMYCKYCHYSEKELQELEKLGLKICLCLCRRNEILILHIIYVFFQFLPRKRPTPKRERNPQNGPGKLIRKRDCLYHYNPFS